MKVMVPCWNSRGLGFPRTPHWRNYSGTTGTVNGKRITLLRASTSDDNRSMTGGGFPVDHKHLIDLLWAASEELSPASLSHPLRSPYPISFPPI